MYGPLALNSTAIDTTSIFYIKYKIDFAYEKFTSKYIIYTWLYLYKVIYKIVLLVIFNREGLQ